MDRKKLAVVHIIKQELKLSDKKYRDTLEEVTGKRSAKDLTDGEFRRLMNYFVRSKHYRLNRYGMTIKQKLYIQSLAREAEWEENHLNNFIRKYYHKPRLEKLTKKEAIKVIESLKNILARQAR